jgi:transcriptional regulator GlxA family with amidase domain
VVVEAIRFIDAHAPAPLGVEQVAAACKVSRRSLEVRFRKETGRTVKEHLDRLRAGIAQDLLATSRLSIAQIAERLGFTDATNLSRMLRRVTGRSPREFRKKT